MRIVRFLDEDGQVQHGQEVEGGRAVLLDGDPLAFFPERPAVTGREVAVGRLLSPVQPSNILCIGMNYREHIAEMGLAVPDRPVVFMKPNGALQHPGEPICIPKCEHDGPETDQEAELAVVIGRDTLDATVEEALSNVLGYTCGNDVSARWWQKHGNEGQFTRGKGFDTFCPLGPVMVTPGDDDDSIADPQALRIRGFVDGDCLQDATTSDMLFSVSELIAILSQDTTLQRGTVILTGTPPGVGWAREPRRLLQPGMTSVIEIEGIGRLENPVASKRA